MIQVLLLILWLLGQSPSEPFASLAVQSFISPDPMGHGASMNLYDYANGDPVNQCDPDGRFGKPAQSYSSYSSPRPPLTYAKSSFRGYAGEGWDSLSHDEQFSAVLNFIPVVGQIKAGVEAVTGYDFVGKRYLSTEEQIGTAVGFAVGLAPSSALARPATGGMVRTASRVPVKFVNEAEQGGLNLFRAGKDGIATREAKSGWKEGDRMLYLPNQGSPKLNWKQNAGRLRAEMKKNKPIFDSYRDPKTGAQLPSGTDPYSPKGRFLNAERKLLESRGWKYDPKTGAYHPPKL